MIGKMLRLWTGATLVALTMFGVVPARANEPVVEAVRFGPANGVGARSIYATVRHQDSGWDHYADAFEVLTIGGDLLTKRVLFHPHVDEQPFERGSDSIVLPSDMNEVLVRAHDSVHGYGPALKVTIPK